MIKRILRKWRNKLHFKFSKLSNFLEKKAKDGTRREECGRVIKINKHDRRFALLIDIGERRYWFSYFFNDSGIPSVKVGNFVCFRYVERYKGNRVFFNITEFERRNR